MNANVRRWGIGLGLVMALGLTAATEPDGPAVGLTDPEFDHLVERTVRIVRDALKDQPDEKNAEKARTAAIVIAAIAQYSQGGANAGRRATVRDAALRLAASIKAEKYADARLQAGSLAQLPADPKAKPRLVAIMDKQIELGEVMNHFASVRSGGTGAERKLDALADNPLSKKNRSLPDKELTEELRSIALRSAAVGELVKGHLNNKVKKFQKAWRDSAEAMRKSGLELAKAVASKDGKAAWNALNRLNDSCTVCHRKFKT